MEIAFHWLPLPLTDVNRAELVSTQKHLYPDYRQGFGYSPRRDGPVFLFRQETRQKIPLGFSFTVTASDPVAQPLPSMELLELRWHLARIVAMQGAMKAEDSYRILTTMRTVTWILTKSGLSCAPALLDVKIPPHW